MNIYRASTVCPGLCWTLGIHKQNVVKLTFNQGHVTNYNTLGNRGKAKEH